MPITHEGPARIHVQSDEGRLTLTVVHAHAWSKQRPFLILDLGDSREVLDYAKARSLGELISLEDPTITVGGASFVLTRQDAADASAWIASAL